MKKEENSPPKFNSLTEAFRAMGLPNPKHPLISVVNGANSEIQMHMLPKSHVLNFYKISYKVNFRGRFKYGQHFYDFNEGGMFFVSPNQFVGAHAKTDDNSCYTLLIHPDLLFSYPLAKKIKLYSFFSYSANEALYLSESEKNVIVSVYKIIEQNYICVTILGVKVA
jgi:hypothetical protein